MPSHDSACGAADERAPTTRRLRHIRTFSGAVAMMAAVTPLMLHVHGVVQAFSYIASGGDSATPVLSDAYVVVLASQVCPPIAVAACDMWIWATGRVRRASEPEEWNSPS